jgi:GNAT superfamily N-acetyltransferase
MIIVATDEDLTFIKTWLHAEHVLFDIGFWNNRSHVERAHREGRLVVLRIHNKAVAFHTHGLVLCTDSIFAVHPNWRRAGLGTKLAEHLIEKAAEMDIALLKIDCSITGSEPFWQSLGFQPVEGHTSYQSHHAYLPLEKALPMPDTGKQVSVKARFFAANSTSLFSEQEVEGKLLADGSVALAKRIVGFSKPTSPDIGVTVEVDGKQIGSQSRAKYQKAAGFIGKDEAFQIEQLWPERWAS